MTNKGLQFKIQIDQALRQSLESMKNSSDKQVEAKGGRKSGIPTILTAKLTMLHREIGLDNVINLGNAFPNIYSPPSASDPRSVKLSFRINDMEVVQMIADIAKATGRPKPHIVYSLIRHIAELYSDVSTETRKTA